MSETKPKRIGLYGGTFDPIHFGHLNLAVSLTERLKLDEVWFCPAHCSPHKQGETQTPPEHRLAMLELAIEGVPHFSVCDWELQQEPPSYTVKTVEHILATYTDAHFYLMMGDDALENLHRWSRIDELIQMIPLAIGSRLQNFDPNSVGLALREAIEKGTHATPQMEISATVLRERLESKLFCGHLVPQKVLDYISKHDLYSRP